MISFNSLGKLGRLGNQLFQIASTIGIAEKNNTRASFPLWEYNDFFEGIISPTGDHSNLQVKEHGFHYSDYEIHQDCDLVGYFQSEKYFKHIEQDIRNQFEFKDELVKKCLSLLPNNGKKNIAIHIRRGDYVGNPSHFNLSIRYYLSALECFDWYSCNLIFFSDDIRYAKWHFECLPNAYFMTGTEIEDLCTMSLCDHFIIANSSFSWWGAWLNKNVHSKIIVRPQEHFAGNLLKHDIEDLYPGNWIRVSDSWRVKLNEIEFIVPVKCDHQDRIDNLNLSLWHLRNTFSTNVHVIEQGPVPRFQYTSTFNKYTHLNIKEFHRTKMINIAVRDSKYHYVVNYDADVLLNPVQIWYAYKLLTSGVSDVVYPYDGNFKHIEKHRQGYVKKDLAWLVGAELSGPIESFGGAIFMNKEKFINSGMENEKFISWGPEDAERYTRFIKVGLTVDRIKGPIYHLDHYRGKDSGRNNPHLEANRYEWHKIRVMEPEALKEYVKTWPWLT